MVIMMVTAIDGFLMVDVLNNVLMRDNNQQ